MKILKKLMAIWLFSTVLSAIAIDYQWPEKEGEGPKDMEAFKILDERFAKASKKSLGTESDDTAIKKLVLDRIKQSKPSVNEIRWLSPALVMVVARGYKGPEAAAGYYYVVEKKKDNWEIVTYYMVSIS